MLIAQRIAIAQRNPRAGTQPSQLRSMILQDLGRHGSSGVRSPAELIQVHGVCTRSCTHDPIRLLL